MGVVSKRATSHSNPAAGVFQVDGGLTKRGPGTGTLQVGSRWSESIKARRACSGQNQRVFPSTFVRIIGESGHGCESPEPTFSHGARPDGKRLDRWTRPGDRG